MSKFGIPAEASSHSLSRFPGANEHPPGRFAPSPCTIRIATCSAGAARPDRRSRCCPTSPIRASFAPTGRRRLRQAHSASSITARSRGGWGWTWRSAHLPRQRLRVPMRGLEIFGDGDAGDELEAQIQASGLADRIAFSRKMFRVEDISAMIQGASVGIICNRRDLATEYMLPVKLLEYVQLGIPAIAPRLMTIQYYFRGKSGGVLRGRQTWRKWLPRSAASTPMRKSGPSWRGRAPNSRGTSIGKFSGTISIAWWMADAACGVANQLTAEVAQGSERSK